MDNPRSESLVRAHHGETSIHLPESAHDPQNKIDHYAVLAQVINTGLEKYLEDPDFQLSLQATATHRQLERKMRGDVIEVILGTLTSPELEQHHQSLTSSQLERFAADSRKWNTITMNIVAGASTFINSFTQLFSILRRVDVDTATHPDNWRLANSLAHLNITQFSAYFTTYLMEFRNWPAFMDQIESTKTGGKKFIEGFPENALVTEAAASIETSVFERKDFYLDGAGPLLAVKDIKLKEPTIGCPVTFKSRVIKQLWSVYADEAYRIEMSPKIYPIGDNAASSG